MTTQVNTKLALLAAMATAAKAMPLTALRDLSHAPQVQAIPRQKWVPPKERAPNTTGPNRKQRRRLASMYVHGKLQLKQPPM